MLARRPIPGATTRREAFCHGNAVRGIDVAAVLELGAHLTDRDPEAANRAELGAVFDRVGHVDVRLERPQLLAQQRGNVVGFIDDARATAYQSVGR